MNTSAVIINAGVGGGIATGFPKIATINPKDQ